MLRLSCRALRFALRFMSESICSMAASESHRAVQEQCLACLTVLRGENNLLMLVKALYQAYCPSC